ncbi:MAG: OB-fold domain-containing protein [Parvularculaceae bacterium]
MALAVVGYGAYVPRRRLSRAAMFDAVGWAQPGLKAFAKGARSYGEWDEDPITMAVEAARAAIASAPEGLIERLVFASTTAPFLDRLNASVVAAALDLGQDVHCLDVSGSQRAATSALIAADGARTLIVAAERRPTKPASALEMQTGDAAAALIVARDADAPIAEVLGAASVADDFVDHYRTAETGTDYVLEERWHRDAGLSQSAPAAAHAAMAEAGVDGVDRLIAALPNPALGLAVAKSLQIDVDRLAGGLIEAYGHAGAAQPLVSLAYELDRVKDGDVLLLTAFGQGCDAIALRVVGAAASKGRAATVIEDGAVDDGYVRFLSAAGALELDWGMRAERDNRTAHSVAHAKSRDVVGFVGGLCRACGTPQFPKARRCVNPDCNALDAQGDYRFADRRGTIKSFTEDWLAFTRSPPLVYGNVDFEGGGNVFMEMTGFDPGEAAIGAPVDMRFRIKDFDRARGFRRYFWKAAPARGGADG